MFWSILFYVNFFDIFLGLYSEWQPLKDTRNGQRIPILHPNDLDLKLLDSKHDISDISNHNGLAHGFTEPQLLSK